MERDGISVLIPAFNSAATIGAAIESALGQSLPPAEIIVVDDGSSDGTADAVVNFAGAVRLIRQQNRGPAAARNTAAAAASGAWLALLDADDLWLPEKLEQQLACATDADVGLIHCRAAAWNGDPLPAEISFERQWKKNDIITSSVLMRRSAFVEIGGFSERDELRSAEDMHLWLRFAASRWRVVTCASDLVRYQPAEGSLSRQYARFAAAELECIREIGDQMGLEAGRVRERLVTALLSHAESAVFRRQMKLGRSLASECLGLGWNWRAAALWGTTLAPPAILDLRRRLLHGPEDSRV